MLMLVLSVGAMAEGAIAIGVQSPDNKDLPAAARQQLENKMQQALTKSGYGGEGDLRFVMNCSVDVLNKELTASMPVMTAYKLAVTFGVLDTETGVVLATATTTVKGAGENDTKAFMQAIKAIRPTDASIKRMLDKSRETIDAMFAAEQTVQEVDTISGSSPLVE